MHEWSQEIQKRLKNLNLPPAREAEIVEEVAQHLEDRYQELVAGGAVEDEARRVALEELSPSALRQAQGGERSRTADGLARGLRRVEQEVKQDTLREVKVAELNVDRKIHLVCPSKRSLSHAAKAFLELVRSS